MKKFLEAGGLVSKNFGRSRCGNVEVGAFFFVGGCVKIFIDFRIFRSHHFWTTPKECGLSHYKNIFCLNKGELFFSSREEKMTFSLKKYGGRKKPFFFRRRGKNNFFLRFTPPLFSP